MKPETRFTMKVKADLKQIPGIWFFKTQERACGGIPDIIGSVMGLFFSLELKVPPNRLKSGSLQAVYLSQIMATGGYAREVIPGNWPQILLELQAMSQGSYDGMANKTTGIFADLPPRQPKLTR